MSLEASGGYWTAAAIILLAAVLSFAVFRAAGWGKSQKTASQPATAATTSGTPPQPAPAPPPPAGNSTGGGAAASAMKFPWGWVKLGVVVLAFIFVCLYAWPTWISPWLEANTPRYQVTQSDTPSREVIYRRIVPEGGAVIAPANGDQSWSEPVTYLPGLRLCTVEEFGADTVAAQMQILGNDGWLDQPALSNAQMRRINQIRFRSLNGASQRVVYSFVPAAERC